MNHIGASVNLIANNNGKVLFIRRISSNWANGKLQLPGGKVEVGESPTAAVIREAKEELGVALSQDDIYPIGVLFVNDNGNEYYAMQFGIRSGNDYQYKIAEPDKCSELVWAEINNLPSDVIDIFKAIINEMLKDEKILIEYGY